MGRPSSAAMIDAGALPIREGFLHKRDATGLMRGWKQRWVRLEGTELAFYGRPDDRKPRARLRLDATSTVEPGDTVLFVPASGSATASYAVFGLRDQDEFERLATNGAAASTERTKSLHDASDVCWSTIAVPTGPRLQLPRSSSVSCCPA